MPLLQRLWSTLLFDLFAIGLCLTTAPVLAVQSVASEAEQNPSELDLQLDLQLVEAGAIEQTQPAQPITQIPSVSQLSTESALPNLAVPASPPASPMAQVTSISQLSDVQPTDWAFEALRSLVERYGCLSGYPDGLFRGQRALTRFEFAAGLNACLDRIYYLWTYPGDITREDIAVLERLQREFGSELATIRSRVDVLEAQTAELEENQFSTTVRLTGEAIFGVADLWGGETGENNVTMFGSRVRLRLETSFTGEDQLIARLQWGNFNRFDPAATESSGAQGERGNGATSEPRLSFDTNTDGNLELDTLLYELPIDDSITVYLLANGADAETDTISLFDSSGDGAVSRFGRRNPAVYRIPGDAGFGLTFEFTDAIQLDLAYIAADASTPDAGAGLLDGEYSAFAQLTLRPIDRLSLGLTYVNAYYQGEVDSGTGSALARLDLGLPIITNAYGAQVNFEVSDRLEIGGWVGYTSARVISTGDAEILNFAAYLGFPDLGGDGNMGGLIVGMQPRLQTASRNLARLLGTDSDADTGLHLEAFYRYQLTDNIAITPGIVWLTAPNHDEANDDLILGTIRTTFSF